MNEWLPFLPFDSHSDSTKNNEEILTTATEIM
jgi:hypothetical protein